MTPSGPIYCETGHPWLFMAEPVNTVTNAFIILAAILAFMQVRRAKIGMPPGLAVLLFLLFATGVGSFFWHAFRTRLALVFDALPGLLFLAPLVLIGFPLEMIAFVHGLNLVYQFWIHTEAIDRFPRWFEAVMNTPSHHRVHHAINACYLDANYAGVLIIWDRMFGTFVPETREDPPRYGIVSQIASFNPLRVATHGWVSLASDLAKSKSSKEFVLYLLAPPGWSPDGSRETSDSIKARWAEFRAAQSPAE